MTDTTKRAAERQALSNPADHNAQVRALRAKLQRGEITRDRVDLAAYCGNRVARALVGQEGFRFEDHLSLEVWTKGLQRWGHVVMVRAGLAAAEVACEAHEEATTFGYPTPDGGWGEHADYGPRQALDAARACLADPSEERRRVCRELFREATRLTGYAPLEERWWLWLLCATFSKAWAKGRLWLPLAVRSAAKAASETQVRKAMQVELSRWALPGEE